MATPEPSRQGSPTSTSKSFVWDQVEVTVELREDSSFHVTERVRAEFIGGPFRTGFREIPLARIDDVANVRVGEVVDGRVQPFRSVEPDELARDVPQTYTSRRIGPNLRIDWTFPETVSETRTFQIELDATGVLRTYPDNDPPYQLISWIGVGAELTEGAPVNAATLTFVLPQPVDPGSTLIQGPGDNLPEAHTEDGQTWVWQASDLRPGESLAAALLFPSIVPAVAPSWQAAADRQAGLDATASPPATPTPGASPVAPT